MRTLLILISLTVTTISFSQSAESFFNSGKQKMANKQFIEAIKDYSRTIKLNPNFELAYVNRALCQMTLSNWRLAIKDCNKAIGLNSNQAIAYFIRGSAKCNIKQNGCSDLQKSLDLGFSKAQQGLDRYCN